MNYDDFKLLSFDCYGTLIDWESGIWNAFQPVILFNNRNDLTREKVLRNFALLESVQQKKLLQCYILKYYLMFIKNLPKKMN